MIKIKELEKQINLLKEEIKKIKTTYPLITASSNLLSEIKPEDMEKRFELKLIVADNEKQKTAPRRAEIGQDYYYISYNGGIGRVIETGDSADNYNFYSGNYYLTREEAEKALERQLAFNRIMQYIYDNDLYFEPDWSDRTKEKYYIYYDTKYKEFMINSNICYWNDRKLPYFKEKSDGQQVLDNCLEDLEIYFDINSIEEVEWCLC